MMLPLLLLLSLLQGVRGNKGGPTLLLMVLDGTQKHDIFNPILTKGAIERQISSLLSHGQQRLAWKGGSLSTRTSTNFA